ncbi:MAG: hypothetical protein K0S45_2367 [Nitrospira sp.]|jgi:hypothetical protein|nr:hypothetical protein [Nitrospira sp.]
MDSKERSIREEGKCFASSSTASFGLIMESLKDWPVIGAVGVSFRWLYRAEPFPFPATRFHRGRPVSIDGFHFKPGLVPR